MVTAIIAIMLGIWDSSQTRKHNRLSVAPYLVVDYAVQVTAQEGRFTVTLTNEGVGPAIIRSVRIDLPAHLGSGSYENWGDVARLLRERGYTVSNYWNFEGGEALGVQKDRQLLHVTMPRGSTDAALQEALTGIQVIVRYASVYGDEHETRLHNDSTARE